MNKRQYSGIYLREILEDILSRSVLLGVLKCGAIGYALDWFPLGWLTGIPHFLFWGVLIGGVLGFLERRDRRNQIETLMRRESLEFDPAPLQDKA